MKTALRYSLPLAAVLAAACGGAGPNLPSDDTMDIQRPDDTDATSQPLTNCTNGNDAFGADAKLEFDELLAATRPYRNLYRAMRLVTKVTKANGKFEHEWSGPRGSITVESSEADDGTVTIDVSAASKDDNESSERKVMEGTVAPDGLSGHWDIFNKDGKNVRTIDWTRTAAGDLTATWKNTQNGKTATYTRTGTSAELKITRPDGSTLDVKWDTTSHAGSAALSGTNNHDGEKCWDADLCTATCAT
jgi:hypothetical protein